MQLIKLDIKRNGDLLRHIPFKNGVNIITNNGSIGNQLGKSTTLRIIKFCLGSKGENIWLDPDSGTINKDIHELVTSGQISFELTIIVNGINYEICRKFEKTKRNLKRISSINGKSLNSIDSFRDEIALIFGHHVKKPSFPTILNRFCRLDKGSVNRMYKFNNFYTSNDEYSLIYSYLFGFAGHSELENDVRLKEEINSLNDRKTHFLNGNSLIEYQDRLRKIDEEIEILQQKENSYDISCLHHASLAKLKRCREKIAKSSIEITQLDTRIYYSKKTISDYKEKKSLVDSNSLSIIYNEAKALIPNLSVTFEDALNFHNRLLDKKAEFVNNQLELIIEEVRVKNNILDVLLKQEKSYFKDISNDSHMAGFILIERELQEKREIRGQTSFIIESVFKFELLIVKLNKKRAELKEIINGYLNDFTKNLSIFNKEFEEITLELFKDYFLVIHAPEDIKSTINFSIVNEDKLAGDGCPRAGAMAIDMAFANYSKLSDSKLPQFTLQDYLEATDEDKLFCLFNQANKLNIQTIVSILSDKLQSMDPKFIKENSILTLDTENKLFYL